MRVRLYMNFFFFFSNGHPPHHIISNVDSHVRRHCNTVAHSLVRMAVSLSQMQVWIEDVPPDINHVFQADLNGLL